MNLSSLMSYRTREHFLAPKKEINITIDTYRRAKDSIFIQVHLMGGSFDISNQVGNRVVGMEGWYLQRQLLVGHKKI